MITAWHRCCDTARRLDEIPGVGPAHATALVASVANPRAFRSGRDFSAWIGLVPKQNSSGGKPKLGSISKQGDRYLRGPFPAGALAVIRYAKIHGTRHRPWLTALLARRPTADRSLVAHWSNTPLAARRFSGSWRLLGNTGVPSCACVGHPYSRNQQIPHYCERTNS